MHDELKYILKSIRWLLFCVLVILSIMCARTAYADTPGQGDYGQAWTEPLAETAPMTALAHETLILVPAKPSAMPVQPDGVKDANIAYWLPLNEDFWVYWDDQIASVETSETSPSVEATVTR